VLVYTCFFAQSSFLAQLLYLQCTSEVFFVDMENGNHVASASSSAASGANDNASSAPLLNNGGTGGNNSSGGSGGNNANGTTTTNGAATLAAESSVSAWRRIFVANEWNRLQGCRRTSLELTLVVIAFAFMGCDLEALAAPQVGRSAQHTIRPTDVNNQRTGACVFEACFSVLSIVHVRVCWRMRAHSSWLSACLGNHACVFICAISLASTTTTL